MNFDFKEKYIVKKQNCRFQSIEITDLDILLKYFENQTNYSST